MYIAAFVFAGSRNRARDGQLMESVYLLAPEWDSTYDLDTDAVESDDVFATGIN